VPTRSSIVHCAIDCLRTTSSVSTFGFSLPCAKIGTPSKGRNDRKSLGVYRVESKLGAGGMGVVYKAHDSTLGRPVALKVLTASSIANADRERRFVQEAKPLLR